MEKRTFRYSSVAAEEYLWTVIWDAIRAYKNDAKFDGEIILFRANDLYPRNITEDVATGWDRVGILRIVNTPGGHAFFLMNSDAQAAIRRELEEAQRRASANSLELESNVR